MSVAACALGVRQPDVSAELAAFLRDARPWGLILFREACVSPGQVARLIAQLRDACDHDALVWIDQEGGRVARMRPPHWPAFPPASFYGTLHALDAAAGVEACHLGHRLIAHMLKPLGVNGDFAPVLDTPAPGSDPIVGDRAFSDDPDRIAVLGRAALEGLHAGGVAACIKHMPGHGRAECDSHLALPRVCVGDNSLAADFSPFRALADAPAAMTAHIVYESLDADAPATWSAKVIGGLIRGEIGFDGLLFSDDLDMKALEGPLRARAERAFAAGCDVVLQCSGSLADMRSVVEGCPALAGRSLERALVVEAIARRAAEPFDAAAGWWRLRQLLAPVWTALA